MRRDYGARDDYFDRQVIGETGTGLRAAVANGVIAAGASGNIYFADSAFAEDTAKEDTATNDSGVPIPDGTKLFVGRVSPLPGLRVIVAFLCTGP